MTKRYRELHLKGTARLCPGWEPNNYGVLPTREKFSAPVHAITRELGDSAYLVTHVETGESVEVPGAYVRWAVPEATQERGATALLEMNRQARALESLRAMGARIEGDEEPAEPEPPEPTHNELGDEACPTCKGTGELDGSDCPDCVPAADGIEAELAADVASAVEVADTEPELNRYMVSADGFEGTVTAINSQTRTARLDRGKGHRWFDWSALKPLNRPPKKKGGRT